MINKQTNQLIPYRLIVLLIDDHFCARDGVKLLLEQIFPDIVVFEAESIEEGLLIARSEPLDLLLLDTQLMGKDWREGLGELKQEFPCLSVVVFSGLDEPELMLESLRLGAMGFIPKSVSKQEFVEALQHVLIGQPYLPASVVGCGSPCMKYSSLATDNKADARAALNLLDLGLTHREFEVLSWLVQGKCNKEIARCLGISEQTVKNHLRPIFQKFEVNHRAELVVKAFQRGIMFNKPKVGN